jgi:tetratricopeptide (TPR) repeat protein
MMPRLSDDDSPSTEETLAGNETLAPAPVRRPTRTTLPRGTTIGRYVVLERIGRGGMGVVHAAYDPELDRKVAVKVLVPRGSDEADAAARQRLVREAQAMARVTHPNVVAVHDVGVHHDRVFVAMEFVEGKTLGRWLETEHPPLAEIVALFVQAGRGLAAAHAKGLVHRDFKPDNVMVSRGDAGLRAQVMDFGLVRALGETEEADTSTGDEREGARASASMANRLTRLGQVVGTPAFMAPEQYDPGPIDARTDQFAFCVALWEVVFGAHPFGGGDPAELAMRVVRGERCEPPPAARAHRRLRAALDRGLAVDRTQRWPSMSELLAELERDPSRRRRRVLAGIGVVAAVGLAVGGERLWHTRQVEACEREGASIEDTWGDDARERVEQGMLATGLARAPESHARLVPWLDRHAQQWHEARTQACLATEVEGDWEPERLTAAVDCLEEDRGELSAILDVLAHADRETVDQAVLWAADLPPPRLCVDEHYLAHQAAPPSNPDARAEHEALRAGLAQIRASYATRHFDEARALLDELRPRVEATEPGSLRIRALGLTAELEDAAIQYEAAEATHRQAFALALELGTIDLAAQTAERMASLVGSRLGRPAEGLWWSDVAAGLYHRLGERDDGMRMAGLLRQRAALRQRRGEFAEALALAEQALAIDEANLGTDHPGIGGDLERLAQIRIDLGDFETAEGLARRAVERFETALCAAHPRVATARHAWAEVLRRLGRNDEALAEHRRALAINEAALPPDHPDVARSLGSVGLSLQQDGHSEEALPLLARALAIMEGAVGPEHIDLTIFLVNLGNAQQSLGRLDAALETHGRALALTEAKLGSEHPTKGVLLVNLATTEILLEHHAQAAVHLQQALVVIEAAHGPLHANVGIVLINLGDVYRKLRRLDEAMAADRRALSIIEAAFDPQHPDVAYPLIGLALTEFERGHPLAALPLAERALAIRATHDVSAAELAYARWTVARALAECEQDPVRMRQLAEQALATLEGHDDESTANIRKVLSGEYPPKRRRPRPTPTGPR